MFHPKGLKPSQEARETPIVGRALCLTPKDSPGLGRVSHLSDKFQDSLTMFSDTEELVAKISAMFPTVSHTHIRILLKKYYNREAVVISALQVEKHPIATPGPLTMSPSAARQLGAGTSTGLLPAMDFPGPSGCSRNLPHLAPPQGSSPGCIMTSGYIRGMRQRQTENQSGRHSSPKMKLKYLKSVYPKADETFILEVLANNDNNIQMAGQDLEAMGFVKKEKDEPQNTELATQPAKKVVLMRTIEDRNHLFAKIQRKYWSVPERLIQIALESVDYNEERADHILMMLLKERTSPILNPPDDQFPRASVIELPEGPHEQPNNAQPEPNIYQSQYHNTPSGPNPAMRQGPQDNLLLEDYMPWNGPNPELRRSQPAGPEWPLQPATPFPLARGPSGLAQGPSGLARGPSGIARGPAGRAQGAMYRNRHRGKK